MSKENKGTKQSAKALEQKAFDLAEQYEMDRETFKVVESNFNEVKAEFYSNMRQYFSQIGNPTSVELSGDSISGSKYRVNRIQNVSVTFDPELVKKAIGTKLASRAITKKYQINDMKRLIEYLKSCNVDPKIFRTFIDVEESIWTSELDRMEKEGLIVPGDLEGTYVAKKSSEYFTVQERPPERGENWSTGKQRD